MHIFIGVTERTHRRERNLIEVKNMKKKLNLPAWIFIGMLAGILVGLCFIKNPGITTDYIKPIGTIYINLLKFLVVPVVLFSIADGVISLKDLRRVGSVGLKTFVYYMFTTALAVVIGLIVVLILKGQLKTVHKQSRAHDYVKSGSMQVNVMNDIFLYRNVTRTAKPKNTSSGSSGSSRSRGGGSF